MLRSKWVVWIVRYAGKHHEAYPTFSEFSARKREREITLTFRQESVQQMACAKSSSRGESKEALVPTWCRRQAAPEDQYRTR